MESLPIVERELRVAARKRSTFWVRLIAALVALVIGCAFLALTLLGSFGFPAASLGKGLFATLTWISLAATLSAGLFLTSDCLSQEKREGTLGFLFLTNLRSYDVVLGKLMATSLRSFYALIAIFPILAVTLLMGGVTGEQFWKTALALVNALLMSLAAGLFVSAVSREAQKALAATLLLLVVLVAAGPLLDGAIAAIQGRSFQPIFSLSSPGFLFVNANAWRPAPFWTGLLVSQVIVWTLLALTCVLLPRTWQEKAATGSMSRNTWSYRWKFGGPRLRARLRQKLVDLNPALWLACRERWQAATFWVATLVLAGAFAWVFTNDASSVVWFAWSYAASAFTLVLYLGIASQAGRFFVEAQRSGLMELLLATPLSARQIVEGQWRGLLRLFGVPLALFLAVQFFGAFLVQQQTWNRMAAATTTVPAATGFSGTTAPTNSPVTTNNNVIITRSSGTSATVVSVRPFSTPNSFATLGIVTASTLTVTANLAALIWFGMWMGMTSTNTNLATLKTILFVQIIPWFVISFAAALAFPLLMLPAIRTQSPTSLQNMVLWYPLITTAISTLLSLGKDTFFILWARRKLLSDFRERATLATAPFQVALPPVLSPVEEIKS